MTKTQTKDAAAQAVDYVGAIAAARERLAALQLGEAFAAPVAEAERVAEDAAHNATTVLFPSAFTPVDVAVLKAFDLVEPIPQADYGRDLADLHDRALTTWPAFAAFLRGGLVLERLSRVITRSAAVVPVRGSTVGDLRFAAGLEARWRFVVAVAQQLHAAGEGGEHARILGHLVPELRAAIAEARARHEEHAAAEAARLEREAAAGEAALLRARLDNVLRFFQAHSQVVFDELELGGDWPTTGARVVELLSRGNLPAGSYADASHIEQYATGLERAEATMRRHVERTRRDAERAQAFAAGPRA